MKMMCRCALLSAATLVVAVVASPAASACDKAAKEKPAVAEAQGCAKEARAPLAANAADVEKKPCERAVAASGTGCCAGAKAAQIAEGGVPADKKPCPGAATAEGSGCPKEKAEPEAVAQNGGR